jgi:hypothetical protein
MSKKKRTSPEEATQQLLETDENFRLLYQKVRDLNGGRVPTSEEIDRHIQDWRIRHANS